MIDLSASDSCFIINLFISGDLSAILAAASPVEMVTKPEMVPSSIKINPLKKKQSLFFLKNKPRTTKSGETNNSPIGKWIIRGCNWLQSGKGGKFNILPPLNFRG